jgi:hypothetical protein
MHRYLRDVALFGICTCTYGGLLFSSCLRLCADSMQSGREPSTSHASMITASRLLPLEALLRDSSLPEGPFGTKDFVEDPKTR